MLVFFRIYSHISWTNLWQICATQYSCTRLLKRITAFTTRGKRATKSTMIEREISTPGVSYQYRRYSSSKLQIPFPKRKKRMNNNTATKRPASKTSTHYCNAQDMQSRNTETKQKISACNHASICRTYARPSHLSTHLHIDMWSYFSRCSSEATVFLRTKHVK